MTKTDYANKIVNDWCEKYNIDRATTDLSRYMYSSGSLAVALEYLGLLSEKDMEYSKTRAGVAEINSDNDGKFHIISVREKLEQCEDDPMENPSINKFHIENSIVDFVKFIDKMNLYEYGLMTKNGSTLELMVDHSKRSIIMSIAELNLTE